MVKKKKNKSFIFNNNKRNWNTKIVKKPDIDPKTSTSNSDILNEQKKRSENSI